MPAESFPVVEAALMPVVEETVAAGRAAEETAAAAPGAAKTVAAGKAAEALQVAEALLARRWAFAEGARLEVAVFVAANRVGRPAVDWGLEVAVRAAWGVAATPGHLGKTVGGSARRVVAGGLGPGASRPEVQAGDFPVELAVRRAAQFSRAAGDGESA
jgi:hypothetical protein